MKQTENNEMYIDLFRFDHADGSVSYLKLQYLEGKPKGKAIERFDPVLGCKLYQWSGLYFIYQNEGYFEFIKNARLSLLAAYKQINDAICAFKKYANSYGRYANVLAKYAVQSAKLLKMIEFIDKNDKKEDYNKDCERLLIVNASVIEKMKMYKLFAEKISSSKFVAFSKKIANASIEDVQNLLNKCRNECSKIDDSMEKYRRHIEQTVFGSGEFYEFEIGESVDNVHTLLFKKKSTFNAA